VGDRRLSETGAGLRPRCASLGPVPKHRAKIILPEDDGMMSGGEP